VKAAVLAAIAAAACGRIDFDLTSDTTDCWPSWRSHAIRFATPHEISELGFDQDQTNPTLSADALTMYFDRAGATNVDVYVTHRDARDLPWSSPAIVASVSSSRNQGQLAVSQDGTFAVFASDRSSATQLYYALGPDANGAFAPATQTQVAPDNVFATSFDPVLVAGGRHLYYGNVLADTSEHVELATRATTSDPFGPPVALDELKLSSEEGDPTLSPDELVIVYTDGNTVMANDLYYATRTSTADPFGTPQLLPDVDLPGVDDRDGWLAYDGCELFFVTNRQGRLKLYVAAAL